MRASQLSRLKALKPRLSAAPSRLNRATDERSLDRRRLADTATRKLHKTKRWQDLRWSVLTRDLFTCQVCGRLEGDTSKLVCDHVEPHRGDVAKFWAGPFQTLCKPCHDGQKQKEEIAARAAGLDVYGGKPASYRPEWLRPSVIPLTIVCGPPASGKNHYVRQHAGSTDLVIDLDLIVANLSGRPVSHRWDRERWLQMALRLRNAMLGELSKQSAWPSAWLIMTEPSAERRAWWADKMQPKAIIVIEADEATCMANAAQDADHDRHHTLLMVRRWWSEYRPRSGDQIVRP
jgi:5-methylcytosine-specific restriction endonuclease McrA